MKSQAFLSLLLLFSTALLRRCSDMKSMQLHSRQKRVVVKPIPTSTRDVRLGAHRYSVFLKWVSDMLAWVMTLNLLPAVFLSQSAHPLLRHVLFPCPTLIWHRRYLGEAYE